MSKITKETFKEMFGGMLLNGRDSTQTYIPLRTNARYGINVALRPIVMRVSSGVVLYGGKFRVGYTLDETHQVVKTTVTDISAEVRAQRLQDFCKGFSWQKSNSLRFSTVVGFGVAATAFDKAGALEGLEENNVAAGFINSLENTYKQYNGVSFGNNKAAAIAALDAAWVLQSTNPSVFKNLQDFTPLPEEVVGKQSKMLNKAQDKYHANVVSFQAKVDELASKAVEKIASE